MRFTTAAVILVVAPLSASAFAPSTAAFAVTKTAGTAAAAKRASSAAHGVECSCPVCAPGVYTASNQCVACPRVSLRMADVAEADAGTEDVPAEVEAMDGVASKEEAHNADRPARGSGIAKHKREGGSKPGIPLAELEIGSSVTGKVKAIQSYGAFLDIGAQTDALLHVSRLSDDFVSNVEDVVKAGDTIDVRIVSVDVDKGQIAVTARSEEAEARAAEGKSGGGRRRDRPRRSGGDRQAQMATLKSLSEAGFDDEKFVEGEVVSTLDFGAFVRFDASQLAEAAEGELDGLVHISALAVGRTESVDEVVSVGDKVQIRVRSLDTEGGKISLSMISKEDEPKPRQRGDKPQRAPRARWSPEEMGASDWKESMESLEQPVFANKAVVVDRRK